MNTDTPDDIDRLFARMEPSPPPEGLPGRVMLAVDARSRRRRRLGALLAAVSVGCMGVFSFLAGQQLGSSGTILFLQVALDVGLAWSAPGEVILAAAELFPWAYAVAIVAGVVGVTFAGRALARPAPSLHGARGTEEGR